MTTTKPSADLDAIHEALTDDDLLKLLSMRGRMLKEEMTLLLILDMKRTLKEGVQIVFNGSIMSEKRRLSPGEQDRIKRTIAQFNPADFSSLFRDGDKSAADGLAADPTMDLDALANATKAKPTR